MCPPQALLLTCIATGIAGSMVYLIAQRLASPWCVLLGRSLQGLWAGGLHAIEQSRVSPKRHFAAAGDRAPAACRRSFLGSYAGAPAAAAAAAGAAATLDRHEQSAALAAWGLACLVLGPLAGAALAPWVFEAGVFGKGAASRLSCLRGEFQ
jgi:MFS family permease